MIRQKVILLIILWLDRTKKHTITFKVDDYENNLISTLAKASKCSKGEIVRRAIWTARVLYDDGLLLKEMVAKQDWNKPFADIVLPIPVLAHKINLDLQLWYQITKENTKKKESTNKNERAQKTAQL